MLSSFKRLPEPLRVLFLVFLAIPIGSLFGVSGLLKIGITPAVLIALGYVLLPLLIARAAFKQDFAVLPLFVLEEFVLLSHCIFNVHNLSPNLQLLRYGLLLAALAWFVLIFFTRDSLYPLLAGNARSWRLSPRINTELPIKLWFADSPDHAINAILRNISMSGMSIYGNEWILQDFLDEKQSLHSFVIHLGHQSQDWMLTTRVVRFEKTNGNVRVGFELLNTNVARLMMSTLIGQQESAHGWLINWKLSSNHHRLATALLGISVLSFFVLPLL